MKFTGNVLHDGTSYKAGDEVPKMEKNQLKALKDAGLVTSEKAEEPVEPTDTGADAGAGQGSEGEEKPQVTWAKDRLIAYAQEKGLTVDETMTRAEIYAVIKEGKTE